MAEASDSACLDNSSIFSEFSEYNNFLYFDKQENLNLFPIGDPYFDFALSVPQRLYTMALRPNGSGEFQRCIMNGAPGVGKTIIMATLAEIWARYNYDVVGAGIQGSILILTFNAGLFMREFCDRHIFKYISDAKYNELNSLINEHKITTNTVRKEDLATKITSLLGEIYGTLVGREVNQTRLVIKGLQQFVNMVFNNTPVEILLEFSEKVPMHQLKEYLDKKCKEGKITIKYDFIEKLKNCVCLLDEVMNIHSQGKLNSRGMALLYVLQSRPEMRLIAADGTLIQNRAKEVLTILQICFPRKEFIYSKYFDEKENLYPDMVSKIETLGKKCILSYPNNDRATPPLFFLGEPFQMLVEKEVGEPEMIACPWMTQSVPLTYEQSKIYQKYDKLVGNNLITSHFNIFYPINNKLFLQISDYHQFGSRCDPQIINILLPETLKKNSPKGYAIISLIEEYIFTPNEERGKVLIVVNDVQEDLNFVGSLLKSNGFIDFNDPTLPNNRCYQCGIPRQKHDEKHVFRSAKFGSAKIG